MGDAVIYTKPGCPYCAAARDDLVQQNIRYVEYDVVADRPALQRMLALNGGQRRVPTIVHGGEVTVGFHGY